MSSLSDDDHERPRPSSGSGVGSRLAETLARAGIAERWYRWCDGTRDWSADATGEYEQDSLRTEHGGFAPLSIDEFMDAYRTAGATAVRGSARFDDRRLRSFTVDVRHDSTVARLEIRLGRGLNSEECALSILVDDQPEAGPELLHVVAHDVLRSRGEDIPHPDAPYPRPIITSRSHLEVSAREIVAMLARVAREWRPQQAGLDGDLVVFMRAVGCAKQSAEHLAALALAGAPMETYAGGEGDDAQEEYQVFPNNGVTLMFHDGVLLAAMMRLQGDEGAPAYPSPDQLVTGLALPASRERIAERFGRPHESDEDLDLYLMNGRWVRFDYENGETTSLSIMLAGGGDEG